MPPAPRNDPKDKPEGGQPPDNGGAPPKTEPKQRAASGKGKKTPLAERIKHKDGCPAKRTEAYTAKRPKTEVVVRVARCVDCGEFATEEAKDGTKEVHSGEDDE